MEHWYDPDKRLHCLVNVVMALYSTECAIAASLAKEYGDKGNPSNHWCWGDIAADMVGILIGTIVRLVLIHSSTGHFQWNWL